MCYETTNISSTRVSTSTTCDDQVGQLGFRSLDSSLFCLSRKGEVISCYFGGSLSVNIEQNDILLYPFETIVIDSGGYFHSSVIIPVLAYIRYWTAA